MIIDYGFFNHDYPYTNFHELNLNWILRQMIELRSDMKNFVNQNTIKYADPIQWNITTQYEGNTVVIEPNSGNAYISSQPVPAGVAITNTDYWSVIGNFSVLYESIKESIAAADDGTNITATEARAEGSLLWLNSKLYKVLSDISVGALYITSGTGQNLEEVTIEELLDEIQAGLNEEKAAREEEDLVLDNRITELEGTIIGTQLYILPETYGAVGDGQTDDTKALQDAINNAIALKCPVYLMNKTYLTDTLYINNNIHIIGEGTLKNRPFKYDTAVNNITAGSNELVVNDGMSYNIYNILRISGGGYNDIMVVTAINENTLTVKRLRMYAGYPFTNDGFAHSFSSGALIERFTDQIYITSNLIACAANEERDFSSNVINDILIDGITFQGDISGYDRTKATVYDVAFNNGLFVYNGDNITVKNCSFDNRMSHHFAIEGRADNILCEHCTFTNAVYEAGESSSWSDSASGFTAHWDERIQETSRIVTHITVKDCEFYNLYAGVFLSAVKYATVENNRIRRCRHYAINIYGGDTGYGIKYVSVLNNKIENCTVEDSSSSFSTGVGIGVQADSIVISGNQFVENNIGLKTGTSCTSLLIDSNEFLANGINLLIASGATSRVSNNMFISASGCEANVRLNNEYVLNNSIIFQSNQYQGVNSTNNSAIHVMKAQNIVFAHEVSRSIRMFKIDSDQESDNITLAYCISLSTDDNFAQTQTERAKIKMINSFTAYQNTFRSSDGILAKSTSELNGITYNVEGETIYDKTTSQLKVNYNGWNVV